MVMGGMMMLGRVVSGALLWAHLPVGTRTSLIIITSASYYHINVTQCSDDYVDHLEGR